MQKPAAAAKFPRLAQHPLREIHAGDLHCRVALLQKRRGVTGAAPEVENFTPRSLFRKLIHFRQEFEHPVRDRAQPVEPVGVVFAGEPVVALFVIGGAEPAAAEHVA